jgi:anaerobic ribonucleoside-triphosphate reductase activating protein
MPQLTLLIDGATGGLLVEAPERVPAGVLTQLTGLLGPGRELACAAPVQVLPPPRVPAEELQVSVCVRLSGYWHGSLIEGPGRRSVAKLQGCPIRCTGCVTPDSWASDGGTRVSVDRLADALLDPAFARDGVSLLGGEPFFQPDGLLALVRALRARRCRHILIYSGYTYERLRHMALRRPAIDAVLDEIQVLVDGPYVAALAGSAGRWTGSGNQRVIDLAATRRLGRVIVLEPEETQLSEGPGSPWM